MPSIDQHENYHLYDRVEQYHSVTIYTCHCSDKNRSNTICYKPNNQGITVSFISKWKEPNNSSFFERVKRTFKPSSALRPRIEQAQKKLQLQISKLDGVSTKLSERDQALFKKIVLAVQQHEMDYSNVLSNELSQVRKITKLVSHARLALEQIQIRLSTITELGDVVVTLNPAMAVVKNVSPGIVNMMPEVDNQMDEISQLLNGILIESGQVTNSSINVTQHTSTMDAQAILDEASSIVENKVKDKLPVLPKTDQNTENKSDEAVLT